MRRGRATCGGGDARGCAGGLCPGREEGSDRSAEGRPGLPVFLEELVGLAEAVVQQHVDASQRQLRVLDGQRRFPILPPRRRLLRAGHNDEEAAGPSRLSSTYLPTYLSIYPPALSRCRLTVPEGRNRGRPNARRRPAFPSPDRAATTLHPPRARKPSKSSDARLAPQHAGAEEPRKRAREARSAGRRELMVTVCSPVELSAALGRPLPGVAVSLAQTRAWRWLRGLGRGCV